MSLRIAHLSDLHFGEAAPALAESLAADIRAAVPDAIAVSGDLTRRARPREFAAAMAFLRGLGAPLLVVPGNHDIPNGSLIERFLAPRRRWLGARGDAPARLELPGLRLLALDSVTRGHWHLDWSAGAIPGHRRAALAAELDADATAPTLVVCHHPLAHAPWAAARRPPRGARALVALLRRHGVAGVLCGHLHRAEVTRLWPGGALQVIAPTALSPRLVGGTNGWNLVDAGPAGLAVETRRWTGEGWHGEDTTPR
jgi:3',5'-cyclic AMP phosphodiesterase CpdA